MSHLIKELCRACMKEISSQGKCLLKAETRILFEAAASREFSVSDGLPHRICYGCFRACQRAKHFRDVCCRSAVALKKLVQDTEPAVVDMINVDISRERVSDFEIYSFNVEPEIPESQNRPLDANERPKAPATPTIIESGIPVLPEAVVVLERLKGILNNNVEVAEGKRSPKRECPELENVCPICLMQFANDRELRSHLKEHISPEHPRCPLCKTSFSHALEAPGHIAICGKASAAGAEEVNAPPPRKQFIGKRRTCPECHQEICYTQYSVHMRGHSNDRPYKCEECGKTFREKKGFKSHLQTHSQERPFGCDQCAETFRTRGMLKNHILGHSDERPFKCDPCGKAFKTVLQLRKHIQNHSPRFICVFCHQKFKTKKGIRGHLSKCQISTEPQPATEPGFTPAESEQ